MSLAADVQAFSPELIQATAESEATQIEAQNIDAKFQTNSIDLVSKPLGSRILKVSDEWFAEASNLTTPTPPVHKPGVFTYAGAWYDGWETRRHNPQPYDFAILRLGVASGKVRGVEIDTRFFNGNQAPEIAVEGCYMTDGNADDAVCKEGFNGWKQILGRKECGPACRQAWLLPELTQAAFTHVRLLMFPDGGIGRFRLFGEAIPVFPTDVNAVFDLAAAVNGGLATSCSDQHFGTIKNLILPGRGVDMGDGWETKRSRGVHIDWAIIKLGAPGEIVRLVVDTAHFRGNFPQKVQLFAAKPSADMPQADDHERWIQILAPQATGPDKEHEYAEKDLSQVLGQSYEYVKLVIIPDGGVKRLRVFGRRSSVS